MANEMFSKGERSPAQKIITGISKLSGSADRFIIVTNQVGDDGIEYPDETMEYIRQMGLLNSAIAQAADVVIEAVYGVPVYLKGAAK